jgi:aminoglycoside phosphotransferase (APT) family kinase protein
MAVALAARAGVDARIVRAEARDARVVVEFPAHIVWIAQGAAAAARLRLEDFVLRTLQGRLPVAIPQPLLVSEGMSLRTRVSGRSGRELHRAAMTDPALGAAYAVDLGTLAAAIHRALSASECQTLTVAGLPSRLAIDLDDVLRAASTLDGARLTLALVDAHEAQAVMPADSAFLHGDLGSHNLVFDDEGRISGLFDFDEASLGDRHYEFRWLPSFGEDFMARALARYREKTDATIEVGRVRRAHALAAMAQLGWGLRITGLGEPWPTHAPGPNAP